PQAHARPATSPAQRAWRRVLPTGAPRKRGERLDPVLTLVLDEVANIVPIPLAAWAATAAGWGIVIIAAAQNIAQLVAHWSAAAADDIMSSLTTKLIWGGAGVPEHLQFASTLGGTTQIREHTGSIGADGQ